VTLFALGGLAPSVEGGSYISPAAHIIGPVRIGAGCWIGPGAVIRADFGPIIIGARTAVEENCIIHCKPGAECVVGSHVTIGHGAVIHGARIDDWASVGMGAVIGVDAQLGEWSLVGEGAVVKSRQRVQPGTIVAGTPATAIGTMDGDRKAFWIEGKRLYEELVVRYLEGLSPL
jgi:carbonic anhydrase/acetyltransferase-like protein (isoleucine patch superfamily)